jgi:hypothetical protein
LPIEPIAARFIDLLMLRALFRACEEPIECFKFDQFAVRRQEAEYIIPPKIPAKVIE